MVKEAELINELARTDPEEAAQEQEVFVERLAQGMAEGSARDPNWYQVEEWVALSESLDVFPSRFNAHPLPAEDKRFETF